ncbi:unnamed protein product [Tilletia controversa]|uniref:Uncharacterized protein n=2 Tax=Tilletia TaxID=13289 RepID=A0A8X7MKE0_9BASI|nr:hypothetical protein CF335_g9249 [Tilletia laevis]KAE8181989.1 hypothetical protein CF328_g8665 [Tilletia controversa]KAE8236727.1 hypothetical protein A4X03_0g9347 [Tilletia caries]KAE8181432.1 hypothetical protein CF336_g8923 [Tilletia laevis]KAE8239522.1 hypothetical protein A4X06_0g8221 [Tilletia controversa]
MAKLRFLFPMTLLLVAIASVGSAPVSKSIDDPSEALSPRYNVPLHARLTRPTQQEVQEAFNAYMTMLLELGGLFIHLWDTGSPSYHQAHAARNALRASWNTYNEMRVAAGMGPYPLPTYLL